jgi:GH24 family phage-related lysozyme (muramidase)
MSNAIHKARELLKELEGLYLTPYQCPAGKWTIGYGHNLEANGLTAEEARRVDFNFEIINSDMVRVWHKVGLSTKETKNILPKYLNAIRVTPETAEYLLNNEISRFFRQLSQYDYFTEAHENIQTALICICFQCGFRGMNVNIYANNERQERRYFIDEIKNKDYQAAGKILKIASVFNTTRKRAMKMAELITKV